VSAVGLPSVAQQARLATVFQRNENVEAGGLMAYGAKNTEQFRQAAVYVDISKHVGRVNDESILVDEIAA
jgi:hypothetical protein